MFALLRGFRDSLVVVVMLGGGYQAYKPLIPPISLEDVRKGATEVRILGMQYLPQIETWCVPGLGV